jgi:CRP-like cAMP-binding protein
MLTVVEKVLLLQAVDVFSEVSTEQLAHLAAISEEVDYPIGTGVYRESDPPDAMYIVLSGGVRLHRDETEVTTARAGAAFGTWALFDDEVRVASATTLSDTRLLRIYKEDFIELLADNVEITQGVLKAVVRRLRGLVERVGGRPSGG